MTSIIPACGHCQRALTYQDRDLCGQETPVCHNCRNRMERRRLNDGKRVTVKLNVKSRGFGCSYRYGWGARLPEMQHAKAYRRAFDTRWRDMSRKAGMAA